MEKMTNHCGGLKNWRREANNTNDIISKHVRSMGLINVDKEILV